MGHVSYIRVVFVSVNSWQAQFDLGKAAQFDDFVEVFCQNLGWLAVRRNGEVWGKTWDYRGTVASFGPIQAHSIVQGSYCHIVDKDGTLHRLYGGKNLGKRSSHWGNLSVSAVTLDRSTGFNLGGPFLSLAMDQEGMISGTDGVLPVGMILPPADFFQNAAHVAAGHQTFFALEPGRPLRTWDVRTGKPFPFKAVPEDVVQMDVTGAAMLLRQNGSILAVRADGSMNEKDLAPPPGVEPAIRVKLGTGAYAQKPDGTWIGWTDQTGDFAKLAGLTATLGPLIDLGAGEFQFRDGDYKSHPLTGSFLLYIVPNAPNSSVSSSPSSATQAAPFINTLGMKFVPVPITGGPTDQQRVLFSVWETRVQDYEMFAKETGRAMSTTFEQGPTHPAMNVSWEDATAFCLWLTNREHTAGTLGANERYRLPNDHEWSCAVGIGERENPLLLPAEKSGKLADVFPWGSAWPPPPGTGNFSGEETLGQKTFANLDSLKDYRDDFIATAPVGSFQPDRSGLYDLSGNVSEWCEDLYEGTPEKGRVQRGGDWSRAERILLRSSDRGRDSPAKRWRSFGFRCVLASSTPPATSAVIVSTGPATATQAAPFINTLGMKFVPVPITGGPTDGQRVLLSIWETRVQDYEVFATETKREWPKPSFEQGPIHPAVMVSWQDATAYCQWLTNRERNAGKLTANEAYRLPSDHEWSCAVGIGDRENAAKLPSEKNHKLADVFPWGNEWPPPAGTGNFSGEETVGKEIDKKNQKPMTGYRDEFIATAQVGSFPPDRLGLYDLSGNAWEWCEDWFDATQKDRIIRGGCWNNAERSSLLSSDRTRSGSGSIRNNIVGFRCVLATTTPSAATSASVPAFTPTQAAWNKMPLDAEYAAQAAANDGWIRADRWYFVGTKVSPVRGFANGAVRLRFRWEKDGVLTVNLRRDTTVPGGGGQRRVALRCGQDGSLQLFPEGVQSTSTKESWIVPKPLPGSESTLEFAVIGNKAVARVNGVVLSSWQIPADLGAGSFDLGNGYHDHQIAVKDVEYTNLDGVTNPEAVLGWEFPANAGTPIALPPDRMAAMRVLEKGGKVTVHTATGAVQTITSVGSFHIGDFTLESVQVQTSQPNDFNDADMALLIGQPKLKRVELNNTKVTGAGLAVLKTLPALDFVSLNGIKPLRDEDLLPLKECRSLVRLELHNVGDKLSSAGLEPILALDQLTDLALGRMTLGDDDLKKIAGLRKLQKLNVSGNTVSAAALEQLKVLPDLEWLTLDLNSLDRPVDFASFPRLTKITTPGLTSVGLKNLAFATRLESLDTSLQPLSAGLLTQLAEVCQGLKELNLNVDRALPPGTSFTALPKLESLIISVFRGDSLFDDAALLDLAKQSLLKKVVVVSAPRLTSQGLAAFKKLRPDVKIDGYALPQAPQAAAEGGQQAITSPDREAALRVLAKGGNVTIQTTTGTITSTASVTGLPAGDFFLVTTVIGKSGGTPNDFNDADLALFSKLPILREISLSQTKITGSGLVVLQTLPKLVKLYLRGNLAMGDSDLAALKECRALDKLYFGDRGLFTSAALEQIGRLGQLAELDPPNVLSNENVKLLLPLRRLKLLRLPSFALSARALEQLQDLPDLEDLEVSLELLDQPLSFAAFPSLRKITTRGLTSDALKSLTTAPNLENLTVEPSHKVDSAVWAQLGQTPLPNLKFLVLRLDTPLPSGELFTSLPKLEKVLVQNNGGRTNAFDDAALLALAKSTTLKTVMLEHAAPKLTLEGVAAFKKLRPDVKIEGAGVPKTSGGTANAAAAPNAAFPPGQWVKRYTDKAEIGQNWIDWGTQWQDGWIKGRSISNDSIVLSAGGQRWSNGGARARYRWVTGGTAQVTLRGGGSNSANTGTEYQFRVEPGRAYFLRGAGRGKQTGSDTFPLNTPVSITLTEGQEFTVEAFVIGHTLCGRVDGKLVMAKTDGLLTEGSFQLSAGKCPYRDLEFIKLDGLSETEALKAAGVDPADLAKLPTAPQTPGPPSSISDDTFPPGRWVKRYNYAADIHQQWYDWGTIWQDGWIKGRSNDGDAISLSAPNAQGKNWGARARYRWNDSANAAVALRVRGAAATNTTEQYVFQAKEGRTYFERTKGTGRPGPDDKFPLSTPVPISLTEGQEIIVEAFVIGDTLYGRVDGKLITAKTDGILTTGGTVLVAANCAFRDLEFINLEGLSEAEALKAAGLGKN